MDGEGAGDDENIDMDDLLDDSFLGADENIDDEHVMDYEEQFWNVGTIDSDLPAEKSNK